MNAKKLRRRVDEMMHDPMLLEVSRLKDTAFTRRREGGMGFTDALCFQLDMGKTTIQSRLNQFYRQVKGGDPISQPAFTKLRAQYDHTPFEVMVRTLVRDEYSGEYALPLWRGFQLLATDGSYLQLPTTPELAREYGVRGRGDRPSAGISVLYDVLHGWVLDAEIDRTDRNERHALARHIDFLADELPCVAGRALLLLDRGYPSYDVLRKLEENGLKYVIRCSCSSFKAVNEAPMGDSLAALEDGTTLRCVKFLLSSGETETLISNLFGLPEADFPALYAMRWSVETLYHKLKREVCVEKFSGKTANSIRQDFWTSMVLLIMVAVFQKEADEAVHERQKSLPVKHFNRARTSDLIISLRDRFIFASLCGNRILADSAMDGIFKELSRAVSPVRPHRHFPRSPKPCAAANQNLKSHL